MSSGERSSLAQSSHGGSVHPPVWVELCGLRVDAFQEVVVGAGYSPSAIGYIVSHEHRRCYAPGSKEAPPKDALAVGVRGAGDGGCARVGKDGADPEACAWGRDERGSVASEVLHFFQLRIKNELSGSGSSSLRAVAVCSRLRSGSAVDKARGAPVGLATTAAGSGRSASIPTAATTTPARSLRILLSRRRRSSLPDGDAERALVSADAAPSAPRQADGSHREEVRGVLDVRDVLRGGGVKRWGGHAWLPRPV